jgi:hypothetical protein
MNKGYIWVVDIDLEKYAVRKEDPLLDKELNEVVK